MNSDERIAAFPLDAEAKAGLALLAALLAFGAIPPARAQSLPAPWSYPYYDGYPPPPGPVAAGEGELPEAMRPDEGEGILPLSEIRRRVATLGFHLVAVPRYKDRIYLAEAEDVHGLMHRLVFDAHAGNIIENTKLAPLPKKTKPAGELSGLEKGSAEAAPASGRPAAPNADGPPDGKNPPAN